MHESNILMLIISSTSILELYADANLVNYDWYGNELKREPPPEDFTTWKDDNSINKRADDKPFLKAVNKFKSWVIKTIPNEDDLNSKNITDAIRRNSIGDVIKGVIQSIGKIFKNPGGIFKSPKKKPGAKGPDRGWADAQFGITPRGAFVAGINEDGHEVYIAKATVDGRKDRICPGTLKAGKKCVRIPVTPWSRCIFKYQVLVGDSYVWYPSYYNERFWSLHPQALVGGKEPLGVGFATNYICRAYQHMNLLIGKLQVERSGQWRRCIVPYKGKTEAKISYDILIDWWD